MAPDEAVGPETLAGFNESDVPTRLGRAAYSFLRFFVVGFCRLYWRLRVEGVEKLPTSGAYILAPVHRAYIDTPLVAAVTRRQLRYMGKLEMWNSKPVGWFLTAMGGFPVARGSADREALRRCEAVLRSGQPLILFPEGTRCDGPIINELYRGVAFLSARTGAPIVPLGIGGSARANPRGKVIMPPTRIRLVVGDPIVPPPREEGRSASRRVTHDLSDRLKAELQVVFDIAQARAR